MQPLVFLCPVTKLHMISGILLDQSTHDALSAQPIDVECPLCLGIHAVTIRRRRAGDEALTAVGS
jgi:hypothetical protein